MDPTELKNKGKHISPGISFALAFSPGTYAQRADFLLPTVVPAARGYADVPKNHNKNYVINVQVPDLTETKKLVPARQTYLVWLITEQTITKNSGQINSLTDFFVKKRKGCLETIPPFKVFITTEYEANVQYRGSEIVLSTQLI